jgi:hypothetical protein
VRFCSLIGQHPTIHGYTYVPGNLNQNFVMRLNPPRRLSYSRSGHAGNGAPRRK